MNNIKPNSSTTLLPKLIGETKHYPPAVKEWKDSVYTYNKIFLKNLPSKDIMTNKIIKNYFMLNDSKYLARSKRMRSMIRKSSTNKIFVSKPEYKQTNDNVSITVYTLDREKQMLLKKIFHNIRKWENIRNIQGVTHIDLFNSYDYWRNKYNLNKSLSRLEKNIFHIKNISSEAQVMKNKYLTLKKQVTLKNKHLVNLNRMHYLKTKYNFYTFKKGRKNIFFKSITLNNKKIKNIPYFGTTHLSEVKFLRYISQFKNNSIQARKCVYYLYLKRILFLLGIKVLSYDMIENDVNSTSNKITQYINDSNILRYKGNILLFSVKEPLGKPEILSLDNVPGNLPYLDKINIILSNFLKNILNNNNLIREDKFSFASFSNINFKEFLLKEYMENSTSFSKNNFLTRSSASSVKTKLDVLKKETSLIKDYINIKINNFKFNKYLPALKLLIGKIYNKNVQLNIVKLKYLYLNSDIYTEVISMKLKKKLSLLKILGKAIKLVKLPSEFTQVTNSVNNIRSLNVYKSLKLNSLFVSSDIQNNKDNLDLVIKNLYPSSLINQQKKSNIQFNTGKDIQDEIKNNTIISTRSSLRAKLIDVINIVKYKWVTGVRLEVAGRLTRRYTASRSVYKYIYKGSLKNTDFSRKLDFLKKSMPVIMLRNNAKTNSQYTYTSSKKRIGAFGIKGWISSY